MLAGGALALNSFAAMPGQAKKAGAAELLPHMDAAMGYLKAADQQLKAGEPVFYGHRVAAMKHTEAAIADLEKGINDYMAAHPGMTRQQAIPEAPPSEAGDKYPHMTGALKLLQQAEAQLNEAAKRYNGERVAGLAETKTAIAQIEEGMKSAAAHKNE